jgi:hypothetical protein
LELARRQAPPVALVIIITGLQPVVLDPEYAAADQTRVVRHIASEPLPQHKRRQRISPRPRTVSNKMRVLARQGNLLAAVRKDRAGRSADGEVRDLMLLNRQFQNEQLGELRGADDEFQPLFMAPIDRSAAA